jgi:hypothetical protein
MSKLSTSLKALIHAPHARPGPVRTSKRIAAVYAAIARDATARGVGVPAWLTISTAATMTLNSPDSLLELYRIATNTNTTTTITTVGVSDSVSTAELMREVGLKCISFNGIPRTINCLAAFHAGLPRHVSSKLSTVPTRHLSEPTLQARLRRGAQLWTSIYRPLDAKLTAKLAQSHPDLPVHILESHYALLLANPPPGSGSGSGSMSASASAVEPSQRVGRVLTSLTAIACLRAQTGVAPQVVSHVFGLRKAFEDGSADAGAGTGTGGEQQQQQQQVVIDGGEWLASDEGGVWILEAVDRIVAALGEGDEDGAEMGFAPLPTRLKAKL